MVLLLLGSQRVLGHQWRRPDLEILLLQVDQVILEVLKDLDCLEVRANQQDLVALPAPENLSTNKHRILAEIS